MKKKNKSNIEPFEKFENELRKKCTEIGNAIMKKEEFKEKYIKLNQEIEKEEDLYCSGYYDITDYVEIVEHQLSDLMELANKYLFGE